jgi:hypothetical protein
MQLLDCCFNMTANILLQGWTGVITYIVAAISNVIAIKGKMTIWIQAILCSLLILFGYVFNTRGLIGFLPIIATTEYTIVGQHAKSNFIVVKLSLLANLLMASVYNFAIGAHPMFLATIIASGFCIKTIIQHKKKNKNDAA